MKLVMPRLRHLVWGAALSFAGGCFITIDEVRPLQGGQGGLDGSTGGGEGGGATSAGGSAGGKGGQGGEGGAGAVDASSAATTTSGGGRDCELLPDLKACIDCFCVQDPIGCNNYFDLLIGIVYCGACADACQAFCADTTLTPSVTCTDCLEGASSAFEQFQASCNVSTPCSNFAATILTCSSI